MPRRRQHRGDQARPGEPADGAQVRGAHQQGGDPPGRRKRAPRVRVSVRAGEEKVFQTFYLFFCSPLSVRINQERRESGGEKTNNIFRRQNKNHSIRMVGTSLAPLRYSLRKCSYLAFPLKNIS